MNYFIDSMKGLGDNIFQRHVVKALVNSGNRIWISTPWPELYKDLNISFVRRETALRTQKKNLDRVSSEVWVDTYPEDCLRISLAYGIRELKNGSIIKAMESKAGFKLSTTDFSLSGYGGLPESIRSGSKPVAVVRPVTVRSEWRNTARSPLPEYVGYCSYELKKAGYWVVSIADLEDGKEWMIGDDPYCDQKFHHGELGINELIGLIEGASLVVGGVGWIVPACIATKTPLFCILGGQGGHNSPGVITDQRMDLSMIRFATPDRFCMCTSMLHQCNKRISNIRYSFPRFLKYYGQAYHKQRYIK